MFRHLHSPLAEFEQDIIVLVPRQRRPNCFVKAAQNKVTIDKGTISFHPNDIS